MPNYNGEITTFAVGNDIDIVRTITNIPSGQTLTSATLTVKLSESATSAIFQITITTVLGSNGVISGAIITFTVAKEYTALLSPGNWCYYDIQLTTSAGKISTPERGKIKGEISIT